MHLSISLLCKQAERIEIEVKSVSLSNLLYTPYIQTPFHRQCRLTISLPDQAVNKRVINISEKGRKKEKKTLNKHLFFVFS